MANIKISDLTLATTPLTGTEELPIVQSSTTVKTLVQDVVDLAVSESVQNGLGTPKMISDLFANRPISDVVGTLFVSTDTGEIFHYNGSTWVLLGGIVNSIASSTLNIDNTIPAAPIINLPYVVYTAVISQNGTNAPTVDYELENTLGFTPTFNYVSPGVYTITNASFAWTNQKTVVFFSTGYMSSPSSIGWQRNSSTQITLTSKNSTTGADENGLIWIATIEIRIYL